MLMVFYALCLAFILVMRLAPHSGLGRVLLRHGVEEPLRRVADLKRHQLLFWLMMAVILTVGGEALIAMGGIELTALYLIDLSIYLDAVMATYLLATVIRGRAAWRAIAGMASVPRFVRRRAVARRRRVRLVRRNADRAANDDDDPAPASLAA
jgi:hypothetical protein